MSQPVNTVPVEDMTRMFEAMVVKLDFIERRTMLDNMLPHEAVRQVFEVFRTFHVSGGPTWPLR